MIPTVEEYFGVQKRLGRFGVEVEVEGNGLPMHLLNYWEIKNDGSLRGESAEYVFKKPLTKTSSMKAIAELNDAFKQNRTQLSWSNRCSTHVHVNCTRLNMIQLMTYISTLYIFEEVLVDWCGESRRGNLFCLTSKSAEGGLIMVADILAHEVFRNVGDGVRYSAINLASLPKFGSVEIRSLRGTTDEGEIRTWLETLEGLYLFSKEFESPADLIQTFSNRGFMTMAKAAFGKNFHKFFNEEDENDKKILSGIRQIQPIAFRFNWEKLFDKKEAVNLSPEWGEVVAHNAPHPGAPRLRPNLRRPGDFIVEFEDAPIQDLPVEEDDDDDDEF